jgi:hypothetical protein
MTAINDAFLKAGRNMRKNGTSEFAERVVARAKQIEDARKKSNSRFKTLPEPTKRFDLRMQDNTTA